MIAQHSRGGKCEVCKECATRSSLSADRAKSEIEALKSRLTKVEQRSIALERERDEARGERDLALVRIENQKQRLIDVSMEHSARAPVRAFIFHADRDVNEREAAL